MKKVSEKDLIGDGVEMSRKLNIFILTDCFSTIAAGAERQIFEFVRHHDRGAFEVTVGCLSRADGALSKLDVATEAFQINRIYDLRGLSQGFRFRDILQHKKIDVLMTFHFGSDIWGTVFGKLAGVPVIVSNRRDMGFWRGARHIAMYRMINRRVHTVIVNARAIQEKFSREEGLPESKFRVFPNGIDESRFAGPFDKDYLRKELKLGSSARIIGTVGNLRAVKGQHYLIRAMTRVVKQAEGVHLVLAGQGEEEASLRVLAENLQLSERVHFLGRRNDVPEIIAGMDVCVLPSLSEGFSNTIMEFMVSGKPIVVTDTGGNPELIRHETTGLLVPPADEAALAGALLRLVNDPELGRRLGTAAREDVLKRFSLRQMIQRYEDFFSEAVQSATGKDI